MSLTNFLPLNCVSSLADSEASGAASEVSKAENSANRVPAVLLHGFGASIFSWERVLKPLAAVIASKVVAFDRPAFGLSSRLTQKGTHPLLCFLLSCFPCVQYIVYTKPEGVYWLAWPCILERGFEICGQCQVVFFYQICLLVFCFILRICRKIPLCFQNGLCRSYCILFLLTLRKSGSITKARRLWL